MHSYDRALAALRDGRYYDKQADRPVALKTSSGVSLEIPGPALLARTYALPWLLGNKTFDPFRRDSALLARRRGTDDEPKAIDQRKLLAPLLRDLSALPELSTEEAGRPYRDLRLFVTEASPAARDRYLADVIAHTRRLLPEWKDAPKAPAKNAAPAKTGAERLTAHRERIRREEEVTAREWLEGFLSGWDDDEAPAPGARFVAADLYASAVEAIEESIELEEERADGSPYRLPRRRVFYDVADKILGPRRRGAKGSAMVYVIPGAS